MEDDKKKKAGPGSAKVSDEADELFQSDESTCNACGGPLKEDKVNLEDFEGGKVYLIENVPALVCEECGEVWVPEESMQEFEEMVETVKKSKREKKELSLPGRRPEKKLRPASKKARISDQKN